MSNNPMSNIKNKIRKLYASSLLESGLEWHQKELVRDFLPTFLFFQKVNLLGKIFVYPFAFIASILYFLVHCFAFSLCFIVWSIGWTGYGIGLLFQYLFLKKQKHETEKN
jgi:hypothetical protein